MQYRAFGRTGWQASALGFGCMRLPTIGEQRDINEPEALRMVRYAIDHGVNYLDSGYGYHNGNSEKFLGRALQDGYRAKVWLATKLPCWAVKEAGDFDRLLNEQLERLQTDYLDVYLLHGLAKERWTAVHDLGILAWAERAMAAGRFRRFGFSFHDKVDVFKEIIDAFDGWAMCQIQYNFMNEEDQAGTKGVEYAASKGLAVVAMEPILGGRLANPPEVVKALWASAETQRRPAEWALQWLWNKPEIAIALSGMSTMEQVEQNVAAAERSRVGSLTDEELSLVAQVRTKYRDLCPIPCTECRYCMPCPNGVDIPRNFGLYNNGVMYNVADESRRWYTHLKEEARAKACIQCRECEPKCPQKIEIGEWMQTVHSVLGEGQPFVCKP